MEPDQQVVNNEFSLGRLITCACHSGQAQWGTALFDTRRWVRSWEQALAALWDAHCGYRSEVMSTDTHTHLGRDEAGAPRNIILARRP